MHRAFNVTALRAPLPSNSLRSLSRFTASGVASSNPPLETFPVETFSEGLRAGFRTHLCGVHCRRLRAAMCGVPRRRRDLGSRPSAQNRRASLARKVLTRTSRLHKLRELSSGQLAPVSLRICGTWLRLTQAEATLFARYDRRDPTPPRRFNRQAKAARVGRAGGRVSRKKCPVCARSCGAKTH